VPQRDDDPFGVNRPYWQRHYGVGQRVHASARARRGCVLTLYVVLALMVLAVIVGAL